MSQENAATIDNCHQRSRSTTREAIERSIAELESARVRWGQTSIQERLVLLERCLNGTATVARQWVALACRAKGIEVDSPLAGEEIASGPLATIRYLRLLLGTFASLARYGIVRFPKKPQEGPTGQLQIQVLPSAGLFDSLLFKGFKAHTRMQPHVRLDHFAEYSAATYRTGGQGASRVSLVLGAGNVSSIAACDALYKLFHRNHVVLLKLNPVNDYLGEVFSAAFWPLIEGGFLRIVFGDAEVGAYVAQHSAIDDVHITGSVHTHESIVWGPAAERARRKAANDPVLKKPITSELGNVTPWIIVPGPYTKRELDFQAENLAASIVNNASFNCIASKLIITQSGWPAREDFLNKLENILSRIPRRMAYYPGAHERFRRFAPAISNVPDTETRLPWTIVRNVAPEEQSHFLAEESFVCVAAETSLPANSPEEFLDSIPDFCNERVYGTLGATIIVHPRFRRLPGNEARLWRAVERLRYGTVAINHWSALGYAIMSAPWGGYPGATLTNPQSGIGWVHNTFMLDGVEKTVLEGPLTVWPKPFWFPSHRNADKVAWRVMELYHRPSMFKLPKLFCSALLG